MAGLLCYGGLESPTPLPLTRLGGGNVEAVNAAPSTGEICQCVVRNLCKDLYSFGAKYKQSNLNRLTVLVETNTYKKLVLLEKKIMKKI